MPSPIIVVPPGAVDDYITLIYSPREVEQVPGMDPEFGIVGQLFDLEAYRTDVWLPRYRFNSPLEMY
ncbi:MAG: hypothetical protein FJ319_07920 [SAR202 cluster bacterium]|nr:hypothetical protein [SAR202 cluster bacterium]